MPSSARKNKHKDLNQLGTLNPQPEAVVDEQFTGTDEFFDPRDIAQVKYEMLRRVANGNSIAEALRAFGFSSRQSFYRARAAFEQRGLAGLVPVRRSVKNNESRQVQHEPADHFRPKLRRNSFEENLARIQEQLDESGTP